MRLAILTVLLATLALPAWPQAQPAERRLAVIPVTSGIPGATSSELWTPSRAQAETAWEALAEAAKSYGLARISGGQPFDLSAYAVQAAGVIARPQRFLNRGPTPIRGVLLNGLCRPNDIWEVRWAMVADGGSCYFRALYDVQRRRLVALTFNGPGSSFRPGGWWAPSVQETELFGVEVAVTPQQALEWARANPTNEPAQQLAARIERGLLRAAGGEALAAEPQLRITAGGWTPSREQMVRATSALGLELKQRDVRRPNYVVRSGGYLGSIRTVTLPGYPLKPGDLRIGLQGIGPAPGAASANGPKSILLMAADCIDAGEGCHIEASLDMTIGAFTDFRFGQP